ncbi:hypothetical protein Krac_10445 [Ktedonobacter racemifer DSM 44963]|uniref:Uncharacterized protein n=1 Tax=Ktedonobacter racemifer DSM 44963 TaxID=485913 RepID=D6TH02_KTERA|nr:hypothetical protein Krac_10445 [Ktedonobacter racemifer DSM 44963]
MEVTTRPPRLLLQGACIYVVFVGLSGSRRDTHHKQTSWYSLGSIDTHAPGAMFTHTTIRFVIVLVLVAPRPFLRSC